MKGLNFIKDKLFKSKTKKEPSYSIQIFLDHNFILEMNNYDKDLEKTVKRIIQELYEKNNLKYLGMFLEYETNIKCILSRTKENPEFTYIYLDN